MKYFRINCSVGSNNLYMTSNRINTSCLTKLKQINLRKAVLFLDKFFNYFWRLQCTEMGFTIFPFGGFIIGTAVSQEVSWPNRKLENHNSVQWRQTGILLSYLHMCYFFYMCKQICSKVPILLYFVRPKHTSDNYYVIFLCTENPGLSGAKFQLSKYMGRVHQKYGFLQKYMF